MAELVNTTPKVALAIYAHPDDADVAAGGTLAKWSQAGCAVHLLVLTDGGRGSFDSQVQPQELAERRTGELADASKHLGLHKLHQLGRGDGELENDEAFRAELVRWIRTIKPDVVLSHDPTAVFFGQDYFNHRDHRVAGWAVLDACFPAAALPHYFPESGPPHSIEGVLLSGTLEPNVYVDVSSTVEAKVLAVECHRSQFSRGGDAHGWAGDVVRSRAQAEGRKAGVAYAEGFRRLHAAG